MKITHKEFLAEQAKLGIKVPKIYEDMSFGPKGEINDDANEPDFQDWDDTDISGPRMESLLTQMMDEVIDDIKKEVTLKYGKPNPVVEKQMAAMIAKLWIDSINRDFLVLKKFNESLQPTGHFNLENARMSVENLAEVLKKTPHEIVQILESQIIFQQIPATDEQRNVIEQLKACYPTNEGFFGDLKNKVMGTIEYNTGNNYAGSPEAQKFVATDRRSKVQIETLTKKGMAPEEAKSAVMFVFDKSGKNPLGFMGKSTEYDPQTKTLKVTTSGGSNPSLMA